MDGANIELEDANTQLEASATAAEQRCAALEQEVQKLQSAQSTLKVSQRLKLAPHFLIPCWIFSTQPNARCRPHMYILVRETACLSTATQCGSAAPVPAARFTRKHKVQM